MPVFCLFTLGCHGNFTAGVTLEQPDLLCTALALNIELLSIIVCAVLETSYQNLNKLTAVRECILNPLFFLTYIGAINNIYIYIFEIQWDRYIAWLSLVQMFV